MNVPVSIVTAAPGDAIARGHLVFEELDPAAPDFEIDRSICEMRSFAGKDGETLVERDGPGLCVLVGAGARERLSARTVRRAAATFVRAVAGCESAALDLTSVRADGLAVSRVVQAAVEGIGGATYRFSAYRSQDRPEVLGSVSLVVGSADEAEAARGLDRGVAVSEAVALARDLANTPAGDMTPRTLADVARDIAGRDGLQVTILDEEAIRAERLGGLLGVAAGSVEPPCLIQLVYEPAGVAADVPTVALVGKGITFDSGGLSLKTGEGMMGMKHDMSGAAAVIATLGACKAAGVGVRVIGIAPCTENMPSGTATKPGDVLTARNGKTIEVLNTDAEGRLVLADGLSLAVEREPDSILDIATLTGACVAALGPEVAGVMSNDSRVVAMVERAAAAAGEPVWHLPLPRSYRKFADSDIADMKNIGRPSSGGALVAGLILSEFVGDRPWAHLDIAGPTTSDEDSFEHRKGSTGFGVRTLIEFVSGYEAIGATADEAADGSVR